MQVCRVSFDDGVPARFVLTEYEVNLPKNKPPLVGPGHLGPGYGEKVISGAPCVRILTEGKTLFVLGPQRRIVELFEAK